MTERKQTPDILAEILGGPAAAVEAGVLPAELPTAKSVRPAKSPAVGKSPAAARPAAERRRPAAGEAKKLAAPRWEHCIASFQEHNGWRLRFVDGVEIPNWAGGVTLSDYIAQAAAEGWQVAGACSGQAMFGRQDKYQIYLKRSQPAPA